MISATSLNAQSALNKGHQIQMGLENGRLRVDSQKFLVPSLPVSARSVGSHHSADPKRRERSIVNGTAHPPPPNDGHYSHHHHTLNHSYPPHSINGLRSSYPPHNSGGRESNGPSSPHNSNNNNHRVSPHHPYLHLNNSPRKDAHSPMYAGEVPGSGVNYSSRSSMPIPCSSPAQASSASPKHSHSPSSATVSGGNYSPKLPSGPAMLPPPPAGAAELTSLASAGRLYSGFPPPHPSVAAHLSPAFYAAAAAAAASHPIPYPLFGPHYSPHSHSAAAASAYLDSFHSALVHRGPNNEIQIQQRSRSPSPSPPARSHGNFHPAQSHSQQQQSHNHHGSGPHQTTSVTSLHNKLIESTAVSSDRHSYNGHHHSHHHVPSGQFSPQGNGSLGISKGGPLGISGGIMNLPSSRLSNGSSPHKHSPQAENLIVHKSQPSNVNGYHIPSKPWMEHPGLTNNDSLNRKIVAEMEAKESRHIGKEGSLKHRVLSQSPLEDMTIPHSPKISKSITFASDTYPPNTASSNRFPNGHHPSPHSHINGHIHVQNNPQSNHGILTDSNHAKKQVNNNHLPNSHLQHSHQPHHPPQQPQFLPPSPKKRSAQWNFAVPASPTTKLDLPPPPPPPLNPTNSSTHSSHSGIHDPTKYLNSNQNHKPSNQHHPLPAPNSTTTSTNTTYLSSGQSAQRSYPFSPRLHGTGSGPNTPKSPSVHQVKFSFSSGSSKENLYGLKSAKSTRNDSSSSTSSNEGNVPWPVEQMPILEAFRRGSLIKLANGDLRPVEDLRAEDFIHAAANMSEHLKIIHCTVLSIQSDASSGNSLCKVTMTIGSQLQNQQVVVPSTPEQPFFVLGRGWSSLSPKTTEKLLQLPCTPLAVGDVCITLSKTTGTSNQPNHASKSQSQVPKSPSTRNKGNGVNGGRNRGAINISTANNINSPTSTTATANLKRSQQQQAQTSPSNASASGENGTKNSKMCGNDSQNQSGKSTSTTANGVKRHSMGPPLTTIVTTSASATAPSVNVKSTDPPIGMDSLRPPSPKRRRWSAPEPEILTPEAANDKSTPVLTKDKPSQPSAPAPKESERDISGERSKTDVNSNVDVETHPRSSPDAQSVKA